MTPATDLFEPQLARDQPKGLGKAMVGGGDKAKRRANDFYPTPVEVTRALLRVEVEAIGEAVNWCNPVWEPCGRGGAISTELKRAGFLVRATDIVADSEHQVLAGDLLAFRAPLSKAVVTNPPFALASDMILHLLGRLGVEYCALLLKASFFHAEERRALFAKHPPARIYALTWRPDFTGGGASTMECAWFIWQRHAPMPGTQYLLLPRQGDTQKALL